MRNAPHALHTYNKTPVDNITERYVNRMNEFIHSFYLSIGRRLTVEVRILE
jgi:hypothetical protein